MSDKKRISEWISKQGSAQNIGNTSISKGTDVISSSHDATNNNNSDNNNLTLGKILARIDYTNAVLEQVQTDFKADMAAIKNALSIDTDRSSSDDAQN